MNLYNFQKQALSDLENGKRFAILNTGCGKTAIMLRWLKDECDTYKLNKVLIVTTPAKRDSGDFIDEAEAWCGQDWAKNRDDFEVISWHGLAKWVRAHLLDIREYVFAFDEVAKAKAGVSSQMGRAFLKITSETPHWTGYTATPADNWLGFYPYFTACGLVRNKTAFLREFAEVQTFKGFPEIVRWRDEDRLEAMWREISTSPDTSAVFAEMPRETHRVVQFKKATGYDKAKKTRLTADGDELDTTMALCHYLRQLSFTPDKQQWLSDFVETLGTNCVIFYSYIEEGDKIEELCRKALPKGTKIWRVDGKHHDVPTAEAIGERDVVLCQWQSGSEALNLQFISYWVSSTPNYSYSTSLQARGRIKRIGQKRPMFFYYLKAEGIEEDIYRCLKAKSDFSEEVWVEKESKM